MAVIPGVFCQGIEFSHEARLASEIKVDGSSYEYASRVPAGLGIISYIQQGTYDIIYIFFI
jgi:hypothetical protein